MTRFEVDDEYVGKFERRVVGAREHEELWVPAEELDEFNQHIRRPIEVIDAYFGEDFRGYIPAAFGLKGKDAKAQFLALAGTLAYSLFDFSLEVTANHVAVFLGFYLWEQSDFTAHGFDQAKRDDVLHALRTRWATTSRSAIPLGIIARSLKLGHFNSLASGVCTNQKHRMAHLPCTRSKNSRSPDLPVNIPEPIHR